MTKNITIKQEEKKLEFTDKDTQSHPEFAQRLYDSFNALKFLTIEAGDELSKRPSPLELDDNPDTKPETPKSPSFFRQYIQNLSGTFFPSSEVTTPRTTASHHDFLGASVATTPRSTS
jgi:hypothetical protein